MRCGEKKNFGFKQNKTGGAGSRGEDEVVQMEENNKID